MVFINVSFEYFRHLQILKDVISKTFFLMHYYAIFCIGTWLFVARAVGWNVMGGAIVAAVVMLLLEYYMWSRWVESLQDEVQPIFNFFFDTLMVSFYYRFQGRFYRTNFVRVLC